MMSTVAKWKALENRVAALEKSSTKKISVKGSDKVLDMEVPRPLELLQACKELLTNLM